MSEITDTLKLIFCPYEKSPVNNNNSCCINKCSASNELFFTDKEPYFERNRLLFAFNYKPSKATTVQIGYLHQFDYKINDETGRDFLQIGCFIKVSKNNE